VIALAEGEHTCCKPKEINGKELDVVAVTPQQLKEPRCIGCA